MKERSEPLGTFGWHNATQFTGALNDNLFKLLIIYALATAWPDKAADTTLAIVGIIFAIPFLLFLGAGGILADRFAKNRVVRGVKLLEITVMGFGVVSLFSGSGMMMVATMFLMSTQSALFGPSKYGIIPELVGNEGISRANSYLQSATYAAIILGTVLAPEISLWLGGNYGLASVTCLVVAVTGYLCARRIAPTPPSGGTRKLSNLFYRDLLTSLREVNRDSYLAMAIYGSALFSMVGAYVQMNFLAYGETALGLGREEATRLFFVTAIGIGAGALLAGRLSRRSIEFGIVPVGTGLMALSCAMIFTVDAGDGAWVAAFWGFLMGVGAGLFLVPVESFVQYRSPPERRGGIVAANAWLSWVGVLSGAVLLFLNSSVFGLSPAEGFLFLAGLLVVLTGVGFVVLPDFFGRFFIFLVARGFYRLRSSGLENVPAHGPALLVSNHASFMDWLWILALQPRRVRFLVSRIYIEERGPLLRWILRVGKVIPVSETDGPKVLLRAIGEARSALEQGDLVGLFPEGRFTRTGHLLPFRPGFERIVRGTGAPIVPMFIQGAYRTRAGLGLADKPKLFSMADFRRSIHVTAGPPLEEQPDLAGRARGAIERCAVEAYREAALGKERLQSVPGDGGRASDARKPEAEAMESVPEDRLPAGRRVCLARAMALEEILRLRKSDRLLVRLPPSHPAFELFFRWLPSISGIEVVSDGDEASEERPPTLLVADRQTDLGDPFFRDLRWAGCFGSEAADTPGWFRGWALPTPQGGPVVAVNVTDADLDGFRQPGHRAGSVGRILPGVAVRIGRGETLEILDPETGQWRDSGRSGRFDEGGFLFLE